MSVRAATAFERCGDEALEYDPLAAEAITFRYDIELGYKRHHLACMDKARRGDLGALDPLSRNGFARIPVLSAATSATLVDRIDQGGGALSPKDLSRAEVDTLFEEMFAGPLDTALRRFFNCLYGVLFVDFSVSTPVTDDVLTRPEGLSFNWHCDVAPTPYVKLLVYLTGRDEHDGATEFLDMATTAHFRRAGYVYCPRPQRVADLTELARLHGIGFVPERLSPERGEAAAFSPGQVLHKGIPPTHGKRVLMSVGIIPAPADWRAFLASNYGYMCNAEIGQFPQVA